MRNDDRTRDGPTRRERRFHGEFSLFFRVKPGHAEALRKSLKEHRNSGYGPEKHDMAVATIHEARSAVDDTRLLRDQFRRPFELLHGGLLTSGPTLALFDVIFKRVDGYDGVPNLAAVQSFVLGAQVSAAAYARNYGGR